MSRKRRTRSSEDRELEEKHLGVFFVFFGFFCMICPLFLLVYFCDIFVAIVPEEYLALSMGLYGGREGGGNHTWLWGVSIILN